MYKRQFLVLILGVTFCAGRPVHAEDHLSEVVAIDLTQSVAASGPDAKSEFQKNIDGVTRLLSESAVGSRITVIGITDHSFTQPDILLLSLIHILCIRDSFISAFSRLKSSM